MEWLVQSAARLILAAQKAWTKKWRFFGLSLCVFFVSVLALARLDLLPDRASAQAPNISLSASPLVAAAGAATTTVAVESPTKIVIPKISLSATVANPNSTDIEVLDNALLSGAVRYPTSAKLGEDGNMVIFGHSSYLPIVHNQAYKTFDGIQNLATGDVITVYSGSTAYTYAVKSVTKEDSNSAGIPLAVSGRELTLSTCDSFGAKSDRFVVVADFVESHPVSE